MKQLAFLAVSAILLVGCSNESALRQSVDTGDFEKVEQLLASHSLPRSLGAELLNRAVFDVNKSGGDYMRIAKALLVAGADPNVLVDTTIGSPLHLAANGPPLEMVRLLLDYHADPNLKNARGGTPLHTAARGGSKDVVDLLLERGANPNAIDEFGMTPLHEAIDGAGLYADLSTGEDGKLFKDEPHEYEEIVDALIGHGASVNANTSGSGSSGTPIHQAADMGQINMADTLLSHGADVSANSADSGSTPLHLAVSAGNIDMVRFLVSHGADVSEKDNFGNTARDEPTIEHEENRAMIDEVLNGNKTRK